jgi:hypothetical protein
MRKLFLGCALLAAGLISTVARAETNYTADFSLGWQKLNIDGANAKELDGDDRLSGRFRMMFLPAERGNNWRLGFQLSGAHSYDETQPFVYKGDAFTDNPYKELDLFVPEFRIAYHIPIQRWFIEPGIGLGVAFGAFTVGEDWDWDHWGESHVRANVAVEPGILFGYNQGQWAVGGEVNYLWTHLDFGDDAGGDITALYLGAFARFQF